MLTRRLAAVSPSMSMARASAMVPTATAILDRILHNAEIIQITGKSYRLKDRVGDVPLLVHHFLKHIAVRFGRESLSITPAALDVFNRYSWPGNVRQLEHELERAAVVCDMETEIDISDLSPDLLGSTAGEIDTQGYRGKLREVVEKVERDLLTAILEETDGNILKTSKLLGLTRKGLKNKMARYGIVAKKE